jgi:hypothetical protein
MSFFSGLKSIFDKEKCERTITYDKKTFRMKTKIGVPGLNFSLDDFKVEPQKFHDFSEFSEALDEYQYQMCKICKGLGKDDKEWRKYNKLRIATLQLLTSMRVTLIAYKNDPESERANLDSIVQRLHSFTSLLTNDVFHYIMPKGSTEQLYKCSCSMLFNSQEELLKHIEMVTDAADFKEHKPISVIPTIESKTLTVAF